MAQILIPHPDAADTFFTDRLTVFCDGKSDQDPLGHPKVYLEMEDNKHVTCPYCSRKFVLKH